MAVSVTYRSTTYSVPETDEEDWGAEVTAQLTALLNGGDATEHESAASNIVAKEPVGADLTIAAAATITWTHNVHMVTGSGGAVTVDSTTGVSAGEFDRQKLTLIGGSDTNTVTLAHAGNLNLNGACVLAAGHHVVLRWDNDGSEWIEESRSH